jgi:hypothetical protein
MEALCVQPSRCVLLRVTDPTEDAESECFFEGPYSSFSHAKMKEEFRG